MIKKFQWETSINGQLKLVSSKYIKDIVVNEKICKNCKNLEITKVIIRPKNISGDKSTDYNALTHVPLKGYKF